MGQACVTVTGTGLLVFIDDVTTDISSRSFSGQVTAWESIPIDGTTYLHLSIKNGNK